MNQFEDNPKKFLLYNFLGGIARGLGFAVGVSLIFALIIWTLSKLTIIPFLGDWIITLIDYIEKARIY
jgi:hypothetical protein